MKTIFTQEEIDAVIDLYKNQVNIDDIINKYDTEEHYIREILKKNEIDRHYNIWSEELYERGFYLYSQKKKLKQISYDLLVSESGFSKAMDKHQLKKRTYSENNRRYNRNSEYFDNINTPNKAYILGLFYADGNNLRNKGKRCVSLKLQDRDKLLLERVKEELEYEGELGFVELNKKNEKHMNQYSLVITDEHLSDQLKKLGVVERKSLILTFPTFLRPDLIRHFVRGYFDGDGNVCYDQKRNKLHSSIVGTLEFCSAVSNILNSMFVKNNIYKPKPYLESNTYVMQTAANLSSFKFLSWLYQDCDMKMERKYNYFMDFCKIYNQPVARIKSL